MFYGKVISGNETAHVDLLHGREGRNGSGPPGKSGRNHAVLIESSVLPDKEALDDAVVAPQHPDRDRIRKLNDEMRSHEPVSTPSRLWVLTPGIVELAGSRLPEVIHRVQTFATFTVDNDPYGEHDFGSFDALGQRIQWKIDYYSPSLDGHSEDAGDERVTCRVLTVMLASEY